MTDLTIGDETFRVRAEGDQTRPTLMLSNSLGTDLTLWEGQMPALLKHFRVIRYDSRGHGRSVTDEGPYSIARLGGDALAILDALEIEKAHFVGISMGGAVAQWLLVNAPERIERAVLANTAARLGTPDVWNERIQSVLSDGMEANAATTIERWFSSDFSARQPDRVAAVHAVLLATPPRGYAACCAALRDMDLREALRSVQHPVLVVTGRADPVVTEEDAALLVETIRGAKHVVLDAKHISNIEAEAAFNEAVVGFLTAPAQAGSPRTGAKPRASRKPATVTRRPTIGRATAARSPLKKSAERAPAKAAKTSGTVAKATNKAGTVRRRPTSKATRTRTTAAERKSAKKSPKAKATEAKRPTTTRPATTTKRPAGKTAPARRATTTAAARGAVKKAAAKATKTAKKTPAKKKDTPKKLPVARRKATTKPRRPAGRRKT